MHQDGEKRGRAEFEGKTLEEATQKGLEALGLTRDQVEVEIIDPGSRGFLGLGSEDARVRLLPKEPGQPVVTPEAEPEAPMAEQEQQVETAQVEAPMAVSPEDADVAQELLEGLLRRMRVDGTVNRHYVEPTPDSRSGALMLDISGRDLSVLIGRQGETLRSLQYILRLMVSHRLKRWLNVEVDVEGYKKRREIQLQQLSQRMAERVVLSGRPVALEVMPANERRIVHIALRNHPKVSTRSSGEEGQRMVTISLQEP